MKAGFIIIPLINSIKSYFVDWKSLICERIFNFRLLKSKRLLLCFLEPPRKKIQSMKNQSGWCFKTDNRTVQHQSPGVSDLRTIIFVTIALNYPTISDLSPSSPTELLAKNDEHQTVVFVQSSLKIGHLMFSVHDWLVLLSWKGFSALQEGMATFPQWV